MSDTDRGAPKGAWDERSKYRTLADSIDQGFCVIEIIFAERGEPEDYRFLEVNRSFEPLTGLRDAVGRTMLELAPTHEPFWAQAYARVAVTGEPARFEHRAEALGRWFDVCAFRVGPPEARQVGVLFQDVSERVLARAILEDADRRKDEFIAILAHELRNPLAPMRTAASLLARAAAGVSAAAKPLDILSRQLDHMSALVEDLVDIGRIARGDVRLALEPCDLREVALRSGEVARTFMDLRGQSFSERLGDEPAPVVADARRLSQAVSNLLRNASKYTRAGGRVEIAVSVGESECAIEVSDDGIGIDPAQLTRIFELFAQEPAGREHSQGGLGIGLAVAKRVALLHGGSVEARSEGAGAGSVFRLSLPKAKS